MLVLIAAGAAGCGRGWTAEQADSAIFVDVRTPEEYAQGHVDGAILIPVEQLETRIAELEPYRDQDIALYCRTGRRSGIALQILQEHGFSRVRNAGSFAGLARQGLPTSTGAPPAGTPPTN